MIDLGNLNIDNVKLGGDQVDKVMVGSVEVWAHVVPVTFLAEFDMADTGKLFKIRSNNTTAGSIQYSSDNSTWIDLTSNISVSGHLKWYVRQKPGGPDVIKISFDSAHFEHANIIEIGSITIFDRMFVSCLYFKTVSDIDTSNGTSFEFMFYGDTELQKVPVLNTSKGSKFNFMFYDNKKLTCIGGVNTTLPGATKTTMFKNNFNLNNPTSAEITSLQSTAGLDYSYSCP